MLARRGFSGENAVYNSAVTARQALDAANDAEPGDRLRRFESRCGPHGSCRREPLERDPDRWTLTA
jgi:hypothetical protein